MKTTKTEHWGLPTEEVSHKDSNNKNPYFEGEQQRMLSRISDFSLLALLWG
ncbi:hypothetical protein [Sinomicrobium sp.]